MRIAGAVLAGGKGSRMGGTDKALITLQDRPFIHHVVKALSPSVEKIFISRHTLSDQACVSEFGTIVIDDVDEIGPLGGVLACLLAAQSYQALVISPCDTPCLSSGWATRLVAAWQIQPKKLHVVFDGARLQPLHMIISTHYTEMLSNYVNEGKRSMLGFLDMLSVVPVDYSDCAEQFRNINTNHQLDDMRTFFIKSCQ